MSTEDKKTDNELIAEFMELPAQESEQDGFRLYTHVDYDGGDWAYGPDDLEYHKSWDWLMPVVEKIAEYRLAYPKESGWVCDCKIVVMRHILYREVISFIKFLNTQPK